MKARHKKFKFPIIGMVMVVGMLVLVYGMSAGWLANFSIFGFSIMGKNEGVHITAVNADNAGIPDIVLKVTNTTHTIATKTTGDDGMAKFALDDGTYDVEAYYNNALLKEQSFTVVKYKANVKVLLTSSLLPSPEPTTSEEPPVTTAPLNPSPPALEPELTQPTTQAPTSTPYTGGNPYWNPSPTPSNQSSTSGSGTTPTGNGFADFINQIIEWIKQLFNTPAP